MKLFGNAIFISKEAKAGYKDPSKTYYNALFSSGTETLNVGVEQECFFGALDKIERFAECELEMDFNPAFRMLMLTDVHSV